VKESELEWVFKCPGCDQVNIITKPEYRRTLREQVRRERQIGRGG
jgi:phage FluMu protein Com